MQATNFTAGAESRKVPIQSTIYVKAKTSWNIDEWFFDAERRRWSRLRNMSTAFWQRYPQLAQVLKREIPEATT